MFASKSFHSSHVHAHVFDRVELTQTSGVSGRIRTLMQPFLEEIARFQPTSEEAEKRRWIYVPYDRLHDGVGPMAESSPEDTIVVMMESRAKGTRRPYHKKKLTLVLSAMRHFALEQGERGCRVVYGSSPTSFADGLLELQDKWQWKELIVNRPAERELRIELRNAEERGLRICTVADTAWLSTREDFEAVFGGFQLEKNVGGKRQYLMDRFYRSMRTKTGFLMQRGKPIGGKWSFDSENRRAYRGEVPVPLAKSKASIFRSRARTQKLPGHLHSKICFRISVLGKMR